MCKKRRVDVPSKPAERQAQTQIDSSGAPGGVIHEAFSIIPLTLLPPEKKFVVVMGQRRGSRGLLMA
jgi:hypothetical protein